MGILELKNVSYRYESRFQNVTAVKNVSCEFESGKVYAIIGKSGSGKTTMLSLLAGLTLPSEGEVLYDGNPTSGLDLDEYRLRNVSVIYQSFCLFPLFTVIENVLYPMELQRLDSKRARVRAGELLKSVGLDEMYFNRFPAELSGGERQRVAIARALATNAKVILADEPTGNLDVENGNNVIAILSELARDKGLCIIIVTHDMGIADTADVVLKMSDGYLTA